MTATPTRLYAGRLAAGATPTFTRVGAGQSGTTVANQTFALPSYAIGDTVFFSFMSGFTNASQYFTGNSGWTILAGAGTNQGVAMYKTMTDTTQTTMTSTMGASASYNSGFAVYSGADTVTYNNYSASSSPSTLAAPSPTPTASSIYLVAPTENASFNTAYSTLTTRYQNITNYTISFADTTVSSGTTATQGTMTGAGVYNVPTFLLSRQVSPTSTLYTATAKTVITSIVIAGGSAAGGMPAIRVAGYDVVRGVSLGQGVTTKLSPGIVIESGETIQGFFEGGYPSGTTQGPDILISGVVMT